MKLLVVGHTYLTAFAQRKYVEMRRQYPDLQLRIVTPRSIRHVFKHYYSERLSELSEQELVVMREFIGRSHMSFILDPLRFIRLLREFRPDRIHIEEDPHSAVGVETVFLARLFCPSARISFFIWDNLAAVPRFPLNIVKRLLTSYGLGRSDLVVCGNSEGERLLRERKGYLGRTAVLPQLGLDPERYTDVPTSLIRDELSIPAGVPLLGFIGRLIEEKGISVLMMALQRLCHLEWRLLILGSGPLEEELSGKWQPILGERLIHRRAVPHADVPAYMRALDVLVLPSRTTSAWKEQFGLVLAEAMMAEVPCIGSSSGAIPEVMGPGGLVFEENSPDELALALERLLTDEAYRTRLAEQAQTFSRLRYSNEVVASAYLRQFGVGL